ncbi:hypothetical protein [Vallitalea maricola]|uniref:Uncharacterized protein n=1 Tax=Vallitalea maricola TaxID=3074433 RepID=A0ACB5UEG5_9FIRM|nr:hypothetical protein AN2V17_02850 [Vallitalea sp. AN17-2]
MLPKPNIIKMPNASTNMFMGLNGCGSGYSSKAAQLTALGTCQTSYSCHPVSGDNCVDSSYSSGCGWTLGIGAGGAAVGAGVTVGIAIT